MQLCKWKLALGALLAFTFLAAGPLVAQPIGYAVESDGDDMLYSIDLATGIATPIGAVGFTDVEALAFQPGTGVLFGFDDDLDELITIDLVTGAGTSIGPSADPSATVGMAFSPDGRLFLAEEGDDNELFELNPVTGASTTIGVMLAAADIDMTALAFDAGGTLFGVTDDDVTVSEVGADESAEGGGDGGFPSGLYTINITTGAATLVGELGVPFIDGGTAFDSDGTLWGLDDSGTVFQINTATGMASIIATTSCVFEGGEPCTQFESLALPFGGPPSVLEIPTLSTLGLAGLVLALALFAVWTMRRRAAA